MPRLREYNLFICHSWDYDDDYVRIVDLLDAAPNFSWKNYSVPEHEPLDGGSDEDLARELAVQIQPASAVVVLAGMYIPHRAWIQYELDLAEASAKPVIGVHPWGSQRAPQAVVEKAMTMVGWNTDSIVAAIRQYAI